MIKDMHKLNNELEHLISIKNRTEDEQHVCKSEVEGALKFPTTDVRHVKHDLRQKKFNLNVEKASRTFEQWMDETEMEGVDMTKEIRKQKARINLDDKNQNFVGQLERNSTANSNLITNDTKEKKHTRTESYLTITGQSRETSSMRGLRGSSPVNEDIFHIPKTTAAGRCYLWDDKCPEASFLVHNNMQKCLHHLSLETQNTQLQDTSISLNEKQRICQLGGPPLKYDTREVHTDIQDLGYETCGKSENEIDREEITSPEYEEDEETFTEVNHMVEKDSKYQYWSHMTPCKNEGFWQTDQKSDVNVLKQHVKKLKGQLQTSQELMHHLQSQSYPSSKFHSFTEEDEGWQSDTTGQHSDIFLEQLATRVSKLESYFYNFRKDAGTQCHLTSDSSPGKYDWLIQTQARELSILRQKLSEGQGACHILTEHLDEAMKSFEEILRANDIDYFMGQSFREHLSQGNQLAKKLNSKLNCKGFSKVHKYMEDKLLVNRSKMKILQKDYLMETFAFTPENRSFSPFSSHGSSESDGSIMLYDQLSANDEIDAFSELSVTNDCTSYEQDSSQDSDLCRNSVFLKNAPHMDTDNKNGLHIFCHTEDFSALKKNILDGKTLLHKIDICVQSFLRIPFLETNGGKVMDCGNVNKLLSAIRTLDNVLEESNCMLSLILSATPSSKQAYKPQTEEQVMKDEICSLKNKVKEQEMLLQKASDHVKHANLVREGMEKRIMKQLTTTCGVLKKARLNLLVNCSHNVLQPSFQLT